MQLEKIKLAGFKSFVDPTTINFPSNLIGVVGPNGCGKSNIIDAVRWVLGESSAKQLRGDSSADVIFNGSIQRKPVGQASVELMFDNSDGKLTGEYAQYNQISIRRQIDRESQSNYYLNNVKCRKRDILDVFYGTGVGSRSYSIIEQGMISQVVEAKPEELRGYLEEVAGISKYKERRRETENRIKHTRENLFNISNLREELGKQQEHLKRQARAAERYKILKEQERLTKAQYLALKWSDLNSELERNNVVIQKQETLLTSYQTDLQHIETEIEKNEIAKTEFGDEFNEIQARYYQVTSEIGRIEQAIEHQKEQRYRLTAELQETEQALSEAINQLNIDQTKLTDLKEVLVRLEPEIEVKHVAFEKMQAEQVKAEEIVKNWQQQWDEFNQQAAASSQTAQVEKTRIHHLEQQQLQANQRLSQIEEELQHIDIGKLPGDIDASQKLVDELNEKIDDQQRQQNECVEKITHQRQANHECDQELNQLRNRLRDAQGRLASLEALQQAALGQSDEHIIQWLEHHQLKDKPRLGQSLKVDSGWEKAVETVLGHHLEAICTDNVDAVAAVMETLEDGSIILLDINVANQTFSKEKGELLLSKIHTTVPVNHLLDGVYIASSLQDALKRRPLLQSNESLITKDGIWIGRNWLRVSRDKNEKTGVLEREESLRSLKKLIEQDKKTVQDVEATLNQGREQLTELENGREELHHALAQLRNALADHSAKLNVMKLQLKEFRIRNEALNKEQIEQQQFISNYQKDLFEAKNIWQSAMQTMEKDADQRERLLKQRDEYQATLNNVKTKATDENNSIHQLDMELLSARGTVSALEQSLERIQHDIELLREKKEQFVHSLERHDSPVEKLQQELEIALEKQLTAEKALNEGKQKMDIFTHELHELSNKRHQVDESLQNARNDLEQKRMQWQEIKVRQSTLLEQLGETEYQLETLLQEMPEDAELTAWQESIERISTRIARLGPINLAAIEEYEEVSKRKEYLDAQQADLEEALDALLTAIRKIDRETRNRFKDTFDKVNDIFKTIFPRVFGGGQAYLELTGDDLLSTGVALMAKPPGKHISSIHQLSGGEKALTAIALVFSLFQLNPSPFCILDEVDAPLDDANVGRFCDLVKEMSQKVQFIFISHNKAAIEMAKHLAGVTMHEPGVSRIVAVDIDSAAAMAEG